MDNGEASGADKQPLFIRLKDKIAPPVRMAEFLAGQIMMGLETLHDQRLYPEEKWSLRPDQVGPLPADPVAAWAVDHIGDMYEIGAGHTVIRLGFVAINEILKTEPLSKITKNAQIPDEVCFWASLITTVTAKAAHSLGYIPIAGYSHASNPVPEMLFGQGVAAVVLATAHYGTKYHESIGKLAREVVINTSKKFNEIREKVGTEKINTNIIET